jgi:hypothetical protein
MNNSEKLRHIVLFQFQEETSESQIVEIVRRFGALKKKIDVIREFEWGENNSPEGKNDGLSHCFTLSFSTIADRDSYLPHPDHVAFAEWVGTWVEKVVVVDHWANEATS